MLVIMAFLIYQTCIAQKRSALQDLYMIFFKKTNPQQQQREKKATVDK